MKQTTPPTEQPTVINAFSRAAHKAHKAHKKKHAQGLIFDTEKELVETINKTAALVTLGSATRYINEHSDGEYDVLTKQAFEDVYAPYQLDVGEKVPKLRAGTKFWLRSEDRRQYRSIIFDPGQEIIFDPSQEMSGARSECYNHWRGFPVKPVRGDWSRMRKHIREIICRSNLPNYVYLIEWLRDLVQHPGQRPGVAVVLRGKKGAGKSILGDWLSAMCGRYAVTVSNPKHITGQFNAHQGGKSSWSPRKQHGQAIRSPKVC